MFKDVGRNFWAFWEQRLTEQSIGAMSTVALKWGLWVPFLSTGGSLTACSLPVSTVRSYTSLGSACPPIDSSHNTTGGGGSAGPNSCSFPQRPAPGWEVTALPEEAGGWPSTACMTTSNAGPHPPPRPWGHIHRWWTRIFHLLIFRVGRWVIENPGSMKGNSGKCENRTLNREFPETLGANPNFLLRTSPLFQMLSLTTFGQMWLLPAVRDREEPYRVLSQLAIPITWSPIFIPHLGLKSQTLIQNHLYLRGNLGKLSLSLNLTLTPTCGSQRLSLWLLTHTASSLLCQDSLSLCPDQRQWSVTAMSLRSWQQPTEEREIALTHRGPAAVKLPWRLSQSLTAPLTGREMSISALSFKGRRTTLLWDASQTGHHLPQQ